MINFLVVQSSFCVCVCVCVCVGVCVFSAWENASDDPVPSVDVFPPPVL